ncbi:thiamine pyrophosphate-dependent enzyme [Geodermatophilus sp. DSM 44513]|uniref:thiamine pyrophosphate-binding protein n=1 Tax=Geodermatophilus sp. DSM 44513 TaxID=1528104 RepID=UPI00128317C8|nr:thiamine pyrophosphate-dependent enzyme [Geodermatophilus sp. DSM 44513]WNV77089.1 thiamine pyrophosphate-binding protein [Geodermatophilus sp. DSM 44513]
MTDREWGSDLAVDLLRQAGIEYVALNPGATIRGLHDSLVHAPDGAPRMVLCLHEGVAVGIAHGYAKASGRPMAVLLHDVVGLQNASMAIYNAWCDRVPMLVLGGTGPMSKARRRPWIDWIHTASAQAEAIRHYVKWDDQPHDLHSVPESFARAVGLATSSPAGPVYWCLDVDLQEERLPADLPEVSLDRFAVPTPPAARPEDLDELAERLRTARFPLFVAGHAGDTPEGFTALVELAELLAAPVLDTGPRLNFPTDHELWAAGMPDRLAEADLVVLLDVDDPLGALRGALSDVRAPAVAITPGHLRVRSWAHDYQALVPTSRHLTSDAVPALTGLLARLREDPAPSGTVAERRAGLAGCVRRTRERWRAAAETATAAGTVPVPRLLSELGRALEGRDWVLAAGTVDRAEHRLWDFTRPRQWCGHSGGGGLGYGPAASVGVALASPPGRIVVDVQGDGDLLFGPQALWTAARLGVPVLFVVHDNRAYGNTVGHARSLGATRGRSAGSEYVGSGLDQPAVDLAGLARSLGVPAWGPVRDPGHLRLALTDALATVAAGRPALIDVLTPGGPGDPEGDR